MQTLSLSTKVKSELEKHYEDLFLTSYNKVQGLDFISPEKATELLKKNINNYYTMKQSEVDRLVVDILSKNWLTTGTPIQFDVNGILIDGQTRLSAIVKSGVSIPIVVVNNVPPAAKYVLDGGHKRSFDQRVKNDEDHPTLLGSTLRMLHAWIYKKNSIGHSRVASTPELLDLLSKHPGVRDSVASYSKQMPVNVISKTIAAFCHYVLNKISPEQAEEFLQKLITGSGLDESSPILVLRNLLINSKSLGITIDNRAKISFIFKTWNAFRSNKKITKGKMIKDLTVPEPI